MLWAVLQNRWQVLSVFKYCKKKISYNCYKAELFVAFFFFNVEVTLYVCLVSVSTVFIKTYTTETDQIGTEIIEELGEQ